MLGEFLSAFASTACLNAAGNLPRLPSCCSAVDTRLKPNGHSIANPKNALIVNTRTTCSASGNLSPPCPACAKASANDRCISVVEECKYGLCLVYIKLDLGRWHWRYMRTLGTPALSHSCKPICCCKIGDGWTISTCQFLRMLVDSGLTVLLTQCAALCNSKVQGHACLHQPGIWLSSVSSTAVQQCVTRVLYLSWEIWHFVHACT